MMIVQDDRYPNVRAVLDPRRKTVTLFKEVEKGVFASRGGSVDPEPHLLEVPEGGEPPIWHEFRERDAVAIRDALVALDETPKAEPLAADERERYLRIIDRLAGTGDAA